MGYLWRAAIINAAAAGIAWAAGFVTLVQIGPVALGATLWSFVPLLALRLWRKMSPWIEAAAASALGVVIAVILGEIARRSM